MELGKRNGGSRILILAMGILVFLVFAMPAGALAATQDSAGSAGATAKQVRIMDPFGLQTFLVQVKAPALAAASVRPASRPMAVRPRVVSVPARGNCRSPFVPPGPPGWVPGPPPWANG